MVDIFFVDVCMIFLGEFGGFCLDSEICKKHFRSTSDIVNIIDNMCQYGLANGPQTKSSDQATF